MASTFNDGGEDDIIGAAVPSLPSVPSSLNMQPKKKPDCIPYDLWIVGAGTLGELVCKSYKQLYPDAAIIAETATNKRHDTLKAMGVEPRLRSNRNEKDYQSAKSVVYCVPPSGCKDYVAEVNEAIQLWSGSLCDGNLVFTSSIAVYGDSDGNTVDEYFRLDTRSNRSTILIAAEEAILHREGNVLRLAGLYNDNRGPHTYWMKLSKEGKTIETNGNGMVNLIHYEDAAALVLAIIETKLKSTVFLGVDDEPISKEEICKAAIASKLFPDAVMPQFASRDGPIGKICNGQLTRSLLKWKPLYPSFRTYMRGLGGESVPLPKSREDKNMLLLSLNDIEAGDIEFNIQESSSQNKSKLPRSKSGLWLPGDDDDDGF